MPRSVAPAFPLGNVTRPWDRTPLSDETASALPTDCDVGIIGTGYTGLHAAIQMASVGGEAFDRNAGLDPVDIGVMTVSLSRGMA